MYFRRRPRVPAGTACPQPQAQSWGSRAALDERMPDRKPRKASVKPALPPTCRGCGGALTDGRRPYCESCRGERWIAQAARSRKRPSDLLAELRDSLAEQLHAAILGAEERGMTRTQIQRLLSRNVPGERIQAALDQLAATGRARRTRAVNDHGNSPVVITRIPHPGMAGIGRWS